MWTPIQSRLALLELRITGTLQRRRAQATAWDWLSELRWTSLSGRRDVLVLRAGGDDDLEKLIDRVWPEWHEVRRRLDAAGFPPTPKGWSALRDQERAEGIGELPDRINQRTALATVGPHSKATLTPRRLAALGDTEVTHDGMVRIRPPEGMLVGRAGRFVPAGPIASVLGEITISDRAFRDGAVLRGTIGAVLLVENLGPYQDLDAPAGWLVAHVPGWDTATVRQLLHQTPDVPVLHFGDLDPNGVRIHRHLRRLRPDLIWVVPPFWEEYVREKGLRGLWPDDLDLAPAPALVQWLAGEELWLEQEPIVLDPRLRTVLQTLGS